MHYLHSDRIACRITLGGLNTILTFYLQLPSRSAGFKCVFVFYLVPDRIDDSDVALHCSDENSVGRRHQKRPERCSCEPDATDELVPGAVVWHTSAIHLDNSRQQRDEGRTHVRDALIHDQNVYRLNNTTMKQSITGTSLWEQLLANIMISWASEILVTNASHYVLSFAIEEKIPVKTKFQLSKLAFLFLKGHSGAD